VTKKQFLTEICDDEQTYDQIPGESFLFRERRGDGQFGNIGHGPDAFQDRYETER